MVKHFLNILLLIYFNTSLSQDSLQINKSDLGKISKQSKTKLSEIELIHSSRKIDKIYLIKPESITNLRFGYQNKNMSEKYKFDLISSLNSNISFGGFWENYAVINLTPQMNIQPTGFLNIYANHFINYLVPVSEIQTYSRSIFFQSLAVLALDNSMKLFIKNKSNWIAETSLFVIKNLLLNFVTDPLTSKNTGTSNSLLQYENYYLYLSVNF